MEKSFRAQLGARGAGARAGAPPGPSAQPLSCNQCLREPGPTQGLGAGSPAWGGDREAGLGVRMEAPWRPALLSTTSARTSLGCPPQHRHPGVQIEDLVLSPSTPSSPLRASQAASPAPKQGWGVRDSEFPWAPNLPLIAVPTTLAHYALSSLPGL